MPDRSNMTSTETGAPRPRIRLYVPDDLGAGVALALGEEQAHYVSHVMRLKVGGELALFNGRDGEWRAAIEGAAKRTLRVTVGRRLRAQTREPDIWLVFAPLKRARLDYLAEKATELGVAALVPVLTRRTIVERVNVERLAANAREAAEQTERLSVPEVRAPVTLQVLIGSWPRGRRIVVCDETGGGRPILEALTGLGSDQGPCAVVTGPEGGFERGEIEAIRALPGAVPVGLGPRLLRADTAALAALACWQAAGLDAA
jgi:16S rRNA (uracil1498-N3)-methyltransferase